MIRKIFAALLVLLPVAFSVAGQTPDWATGAAPIIYNRCASCHHSGGIAPFPLLTYTDALNNASSILADVTSKKMPPWPPDASYSRFAHERILSQAEINTLADWVNGGALQGNISMAPPQPIFNNNGNIPGTPDFSAAIPTYVSTASTNDVYQCFVMPSGTLTDQFITAFEAIPGNPGIVHHVLVYADTTGTCRQLDSLSPGPGYTSFGGVGSNSAILIGAWVPGSAPMIYPQGFGLRLPKNADIVLQIHYPTGTAGQSDNTQIHLFFSPTPSVRNVFIDPILNYYTNIIPSLFIPANTTKSFAEKYLMPNVDISLLGVAPHMHLIGQSIKSFGVTPLSDTLKFINLPKWDFHWQGFYMMPKLRKIPAKTTLYASAYYDNTTNNVENPNSPPKNVSAGEQTTDEMMIVFFVYTLYQPGDENIAIDSNAALAISPLDYYHGQQLLEPYPNPAKNELVVKYYFDQPDKGTIELLSSDGRSVRSLSQYQPMSQGYSAFSYNISDVPSGVYLLRLMTDRATRTQKVIITH